MGSASRVVVVGAGNAALVAALAAHDRGAEVTVLEAAPHAERGGNSRFSGGIFRFAHGGLEALQDILTHDKSWPLERIVVEPYPVATYLDDIASTSQGASDSELVALLVEESEDTVRWMHARGVEWELTVGKLIDPDRLGETETYVLPPGGAVRARGEGVGLMANLFGAIEERGIEVRYDHEVVDFSWRDRSVVGVVAGTGSELVEIKADAVVIAAGGFEANPEMRARYLGANWDVVKVRGSRFNSGNVLSTALRYGAQAAGHWSGCHSVPVDADAPQVGDLSITDKMSRYSYPYSIMVNAEGNRFVDEGEDQVWLTYAKTGAAIRSQPLARAFQIFDDKTTHLLEPRYTTATRITADSIRELAEKLGLPPARLEATVSEFNDATPSSNGTFDPFTKDGLRTNPNLSPPKSNWALPIDRPPFVAYKVTCGITFTFGGVKVDTRARVLDGGDRPVPGLYATGELTGGFFYYNYPAGAGLMRGAVLGRIAGFEAAGSGA